ncbi:MAG: NAD(P)-dependent glycerol-3-phosphate dehydrogenase [Desulfovibrionaceae bacterium]|nr:NAD(P)-dependent glycerol-3-phosphate dehydrogenase [Desulfovibrionaceae bacterium]
MNDPITVAGGGAWGSALAHLLVENGHACRLWVRDPKQCATIEATHTNPRYLAGYTLSKRLAVTSDPSALSAPIVVCAVPCQQLRSFLAAHADFFTSDVLLVNVAKGLELTRRIPCSRIVSEELRTPCYAMLSGPSFASGVLEGHPTAVSLACASGDKGRALCKIFSNSRFRAYYTDDVLGVELGGALKNVMAIAAGIADALLLGPNARSALITRALAEMARLGLALGAQETTFMGLSGIGDLVLTCTTDNSRNRRVGLGLGRGKALSEVLATLGGVAEGVPTAAAVVELAKEYGVDMPLTRAVYAVCHKGVAPSAVVHDLLARIVRDERWSSSV